MSGTEVLENSSSASQIQEPKLSKENSYTYWVKNDPNFFAGQQGIDFQPKRIDHEEAEKIKA